MGQGESLVVSDSLETPASEIGNEPQWVWCAEWPVGNFQWVQRRPGTGSDGWSTSAMEAELGLFSLEERRLQAEFIAPFSAWRKPVRKMGTTFLENQSR